MPHNLLLKANAVVKTALALLLIAAVFMSCTNIVLRYVLKVSWIAGDELQVFSMVALAFLGTIVVSAENRQLRLDFIAQAAGPSVRRGLSILEALLTIAICGSVTYHSWAFLARIFSMGQRGGSSGMPMWIPHGTVTICFAMLTVMGLFRLIHNLRPAAPEKA